MFQPYERKEDAPVILSRLQELTEHADSSNGLLSGLGSFWTDNYSDVAALQRASTGSIVSLSTKYRRLLNLVLESSIINAPSVQVNQLDLLLFDNNEAIIDNQSGTITYKNIGISSMPFLVSSLFNTQIILQCGVHYNIIEDSEKDGVYHLIFYVNIFEDDTILEKVYAFDGVNNKYILFWGIDVVVATTELYERYGRFLYKKAEDSVRYKWVLKALQYFYTNTKSVNLVSDTLNIIFGLPFTETNNETVLKVGVPPDEERSGYYDITTDNKTYYVPTYAELSEKVKKGSILPQYTLLGTMNHIKDYISDPSWIWSAPIPEGMFNDNVNLSEDEKRQLIDAVLKYNMVYVDLNISYATKEIYALQKEEINRVLKTGLPVYLYPSVSVAFNPDFERDVDHYYMTPIYNSETGKKIDGGDAAASDDTFLALRTNMESRFSAELLKFNGQYYYNGNPELDCGWEYKKIIYYKFNGDHTYKDHITCDATYNCTRTFDGTYDYCSKYQLFANAERDHLEFHGNCRVPFTDTFPYTQRSTAYASYITYKDIYLCDGTYKFGVNTIAPKDKYSKKRRGITSIIHEFYDFMADTQNEGMAFSETINTTEEFDFQQRYKQSLNN